MSVLVFLIVGTYSAVAIFDVCLIVYLVWPSIARVLTARRKRLDWPKARRLP